MNELVYVLAVEALVFGALCTVLVAQRVNIFSWQPDKTWPVFASSLQVLLLNAHVLLLVCCFVAAGAFESFAVDVRDACARSAGRLATAPILASAYVAGVLALRSNAGECVLCQLLGTSCVEPVAAWSLSYTTYLAVLLPVAALQAALLLSASGMCKEKRVSPRRVTTAHCAVLIALQVHSTLERNATQLPGSCKTSAEQNKLSAAHASEPMLHVLILFFVLYALDATADFAASLVIAGRAAGRLPLFFSLCRAAALAAPWALCMLWDEEMLPFQILLAHTALALLLAAFDIADVWLNHFIVLETQASAAAHDEKLPGIKEEEQTKSVKASSALLLPPKTTAALSAFEIEPARRRRFVLEFNNKSRWPVQAAVKKAE